jgi:hypothetical protein
MATTNTQTRGIDVIVTNASTKMAIPPRISTKGSIHAAKPGKGVPICISNFSKFAGPLVSFAQPCTINP